jgi:hypothetical protein
VGASSDAVHVGPPRLAVEQSVRLAALARVAMNAAASSRRIVLGAKSAQKRRLPIVMRTPTGPSGPPSGSPVAVPRRRTTLPCFNRIERTVELPPGADLFTNSYETGLAAWIFHPGADGTSSVAAPAFGENSSMTTPPGVPVLGSSALPTAGKGNAGSRLTKPSFSCPLLVWRRTSFAADTG